MHDVRIHARISPRESTADRELHLRSDEDVQDQRPHAADPGARQWHQAHGWCDRYQLGRVDGAQTVRARRSAAQVGRVLGTAVPCCLLWKVRPCRDSVPHHDSERGRQPQLHLPNHAAAAGWIDGSEPVQAHGKEEVHADPATVEEGPEEDLRRQGQERDESVPAAARGTAVHQEELTNPNVRAAMLQRNHQSRKEEQPSQRGRSGLRAGRRARPEPGCRLHPRRWK
mmetsp:Transcript_1153/g.3357  ORF Transcript_1153/g.3357 Transcript_1153/m.3357 type:complete len:227 (+) Transcript_1153:2463-3143(+)